MSRQAMEMALDCLLYYQSRETNQSDDSPTSKTIGALRAALAEAEAPKAEPVVLSAEEIINLWKGENVRFMDLLDFARAVLAQGGKG